MTEGSSFVPEGWPRVVPRIVVGDPQGLVRFVQEVFAAKGGFNADRPSELWIGGSVIMISSPLAREVMTAFLYVYVEDVDATYRKAIAAGATSLEEPTDMPYGDRRAMLRDPWDNTWQIATHGGRFTP